MIKAGDIIFHTRFGKGKVIAVEGDWLYIHWQNGNESRVLAKDCIQRKK